MRRDSVTKLRGDAVRRDSLAGRSAPKTSTATSKFSMSIDAKGGHTEVRLVQFDNEENVKECVLPPGLELAELKEAIQYLMGFVEHEIMSNDFGQLVATDDDLLQAFKMYEMNENARRRL